MGASGPPCELGLNPRALFERKGLRGGKESKVALPISHPEKAVAEAHSCHSASFRSGWHEASGEGKTVPCWDVFWSGGGEALTFEAATGNALGPLWSEMRGAPSFIAVN